MKTQLTATVVNGTLQFDEPLNLPEHSRVTVSVLPKPSDVLRRQEILRKLFDSFDEQPINVAPFTRDQMHDRD